MGGSRAQAGGLHLRRGAGTGPGAEESDAYLVSLKVHC